MNCIYEDLGGKVFCQSDILIPIGQFGKHNHQDQILGTLNVYLQIQADYGLQIYVLNFNQSTSSLHSHQPHQKCTF